MKKQEIEKITDREIGKVFKDAYIDFGSYINTSRHLVNVSDGLKVSYKRLIYSATQFPKNKLAHSTTLINMVANYHPHGLGSMNQMLATLIKSGIFEGEGSFGYKGIDGTVNEPANERYTSSGLSKLYWEIMGDLIKEVPYTESPVGELEPEYIPTPLPLCLILKTMTSGLGVGISTLYPNFSAWSLYQAYKNNDPGLLEPNVDLGILKAKSELDRVWTTGKGKISYAYRTTRIKAHDGKTEGVLIDTNDGTEIFTPRLSKLDKLVAEGKVFMEDLTDNTGAKLFIGRVPGAKGVTVDDIDDIVQTAAVTSPTFLLNVTDGKIAFRIPLYDWVDYTYKNYINLVTAVNQKKIEKAEHDLAVQKAIPVVSDYIINKNPKATDKEILDATGLDPEVLSAVLSKPISFLRSNKDTTSRVKEIKERLKELKAFDPIAYTEEIIRRL